MQSDSDEEALARSLDRSASDRETAKYLKQFYSEPDVATMQAGRVLAEADLKSWTDRLAVATSKERPAVEKKIAQCQANLDKIKADLLVCPKPTPALVAGQMVDSGSQVTSPQPETDPGDLDEEPVETVALARAKSLLEFKDRARRKGIKATDKMIAQAANPGKWNDRTMVTWWKRNDKNCGRRVDILIRAVLAKDPSNIWKLDPKSK